MSLLRTTVAVSLGLALSLSAHAYTSVVAFGDSLTDNGRLLALSGGQIPQNPYFNGRFSNGPAAIEYLAQGLNVPLVDFAVGGASTGLFNNEAPAPFLNTGMLSQVNGFLAAGKVDANALYFLWGGPNDFRALLSNPALDPNAVAGSVVQNLTGAVTTLYSHGARSFLLPLLPDLGATPEAASYGQATATALTALSSGVNASLAGAYAQLGANMPGSHLIVFDTLAAEHQVLASASQFGITNTTAPCFTGFVGVPGTECATPNSYFYWDAIHPTATVHAALGQQFLAAAVPEPSTYGMMGLGLAALAGLKARRRAKTATVS